MAAGPRLIPILLSIIAALFLLTGARHLSYADPYLAFALGGAAIFYIRLRVPGKEWLGWFAALLLFVPFLNLPPVKDPILWIASTCALMGFASFLLLLLRTIWSDNDSRKIAIAQLVPEGMLVLYILSAQHALNLAGILHPRTLDLYLFSFDGSLGFQPSFAVAAAVRVHPILSFICMLTYVSLPLAMGAAYAAYIDPRDTKPSWYMLKLFVLAGLLGWGFYSLFPACGPRYAFPEDFPHYQLPYASLSHLFMEATPLSQLFPRNAMPSLHMTWVLLIWWSSTRFGRLARLLVFLYLIFTVLGTLATGEHYLIDLVVAFPFALAVQSLCFGSEANPKRSWVIIATLAFAMTGLWLGLLRYSSGIFLYSRWLPWLSLVGTVAVVEVLRHRLPSEARPQSCTQPATNSTAEA